MTGNSMIALMLMLLLCFIGMLVMFLFVIRSNTILSDTLKESIRQQRQALHDIERQLLELSFTVNKAEVKEVCGQYAEFSQFADGGGADAVNLTQPEVPHAPANSRHSHGDDTDRQTMSLPKLSL